MPYENQVWRLMKRPVGDIADGDLVYGKEPVPDLKEGEYLVEVIYLSLTQETAMLTTKILISVIATTTLSLNDFDGLYSADTHSPELAAVGATLEPMAANGLESQDLVALGAGQDWNMFAR